MIKTLALILFGSCLGFFAAIVHAAQPKGLSRKVARKLPLEQGKVTIPDHEGNYDLDGVSFDSSGVVVASDKAVPAPI